MNLFYDLYINNLNIPCQVSSLFYLSKLPKNSKMITTIKSLISSNLPTNSKDNWLNLPNRMSKSHKKNLEDTPTIFFKNMRPQELGSILISWTALRTLFLPIWPRSLLRNNPARWRIPFFLTPSNMIISKMLSKIINYCKINTAKRKRKRNWMR